MHEYVYSKVLSSQLYERLCHVDVRSTSCNHWLYNWLDECLHNAAGFKKLVIQLDNWLYNWMHCVYYYAA